jgi:uncharacterized membrane protein
MDDSTKTNIIAAHEKTRSWMGTALGGALGFIIAGPIGAVIGAGAGYIGHDAKSLTKDEPKED